MFEPTKSRLVQTSPLGRLAHHGQLSALTLFPAGDGLEILAGFKRVRDPRVRVANAVRADPNIQADVRLVPIAARFMGLHARYVPDQNVHARIITQGNCHD